MSGDTQPAFDPHRARRHGSRSSAALLCHEAPEGLEFSRSGTGVGNLVYRRFTHFDAEVTPDFTTFSRSFALLSPAVTEQIHQRGL